MKRIRESADIRYNDVLCLPNRNLYIKENIDETVFMFALFKCRKSDKGRN